MSRTVDERYRRTEPAKAAPRPSPPLDPSTPPLTQVVLIDARAERLAVMRALLEGGTLAAVVGEAENEAGAVEVVGRTGADLAVIEIQMPVAAGLAVVAALRQHFPQLRIVVCSFHRDAATKQQALDNGADAYLAKPVDYAALGRLLRLYAETPREQAPE